MKPLEAAVLILLLKVQSQNLEIFWKKLLNPAGADSFGDNGDEDEYPDDIEDTGRFWGKDNVRQKGVNELVCGEGSVGTVECWDYYVFWIRVVKDKCGDPDCI